MAHNDPQVPWTDEQWARVQQVVQEEASRARLAATFLPLVGPLVGSADFVRKDLIGYTPRPGAVGRITIDDKHIIQLATLQVRVPVRGREMADPEMTSVLALFRRAANVLARLEDAVVFRGLLVADPINPGQFIPPPGIIDYNRIWEIRSGEQATGLWTLTAPWSRWVFMPAFPRNRRGERLVRGISEAIGRLESRGHYGPFAAVFDQRLFLVATAPDRSLVMPRDRIIPFLDGGPLHRSSTLDQWPTIFTGLVVALGGAPIELVVARDVSCQFLQLTTDPVFEFRVYERMALRIKEPDAIVQLVMW